ncbi:MAG: adenylate/guanylate cyclase domain-containing protein [Methylococcales bacterium]|nr:adenylate/guanylate cyclase domain-containing protein [Methylococcales bacterium]
MCRFGFRRFRNRLLFYFIGLFAFTLTGVFVVVEQVFKQNTEANIRSELVVTERVFSQLLKERSTQLTQWAITLASDFAFKKVMMTGDPATISSALFNLSKRIGADAALLVSIDYKLVADVAHPGANGQLFFAAPMIKQAEEYGAASTLALIDQQPYQLVTVPVLAPDPVAWLCIGFKIDQALLMKLKQLTQMEISILSETPARIILHASTLISQPNPELNGIWQKSAAEENFFWFYNKKPYLSRLIVLHKQTDFSIAALIQRSWDDALANFYRLRWLLAGIALSSMAIILLVGAWVARTVSKPMQILVKGVRAIGLGDYKYKVNLSARDETGELGRAFNEMSGQLAEKEKIRNLLGKVVSPVIVKELMSREITLGGETREITALFSDLAGFTTIAENMQPQALVALLNDYLTQMGKQIITNNGVIDKFIGDAIVAFWGAPVMEQNHAVLALKSALAMQRVLAGLRTQWKKQGLPGLLMRIGVNTGLAVVGNIGSIDRMDYTMMGDAVNLAARLEGANKFYGTGILLSEYTYAQVKDVFLCRELDRVRVQGKRQPVGVFQLMDEHSRINSATKAHCEEFAAALREFRQGRWLQAEQLFTSILLEHQDDTVSQVYLVRSQQLQLNPPDARCDGIYDLQK